MPILWSGYQGLKECVTLNLRQPKNILLAIVETKAEGS